ncbi:amidohydrolase family protein [Amycolatopsis sp. NPDC001319]|uniref:amidohydrolase family protein n=1 Tax=unclassified Amycolatopsis TaxID=2618356 RepID=UPI0036C603A4
MLARRQRARSDRQPTAPVQRCVRPAHRVVARSSAITAREALHLYTPGSATTQFAEHTLGTIDRGKLADVVVLGADPLSVDPGAIKDIGVDLTVVDGRVVYEKA